MKYIIILMLFFSCNTISNEVDTKKGERIFKEKLDSVRSYVYKETNDSSLAFVGQIPFFERITKIESEADGTSFGKLHITKKDYHNWQSWYNKNKAFLKWDEVNQQVIYAP